MKGKVYDVTNYLNQHPGGVSMLMKVAGADATSLFDKTHPWIKFETMKVSENLKGIFSEEPNINEESNSSPLRMLYNVILNLWK